MRAHGKGGTCGRQQFAFWSVHAMTTLRSLLLNGIAVIFAAAALLGANSTGALAVEAGGAAASDLSRATASGMSLVMIEEDGCGFCRRWHIDVGEGYGRSEEGRRAPLVRVDRSSKEAERFPRIVYTPTFILVSDGQERGRITGYPGADFFWSLLADLMRKADGPRAADDGALKTVDPRSR